MNCLGISSPPVRMKKKKMMHVCMYVCVLPACVLVHACRRSSCRCCCSRFKHNSPCRSHHHHQHHSVPCRYCSHSSTDPLSSSPSPFLDCSVVLFTARLAFILPDTSDASVFPAYMVIVHTVTQKPGLRIKPKIIFKK